jgi:hypothetical protein
VPDRSSIVMQNVLIAIVTDSYKVIQDQRAAIVFWTNRLAYIAEMDAVANGPWKAKIKKYFGLEDKEDKTAVEITFGKSAWRGLMDLFEDDIEAGFFSIDYFLQTIFRIIAALFVIPFWLLLGLFTFGWFWPPQIREMTFTSRVFKQQTEADKEELLRKAQVQILTNEVANLKNEILQELAVDRTQVVQLKSAVAARKIEIQQEMKNIKRVVAMLFEQMSSR